MNRQPEPGFLVLETGHVFKGNFLGGTERAGEVVFNTSHTGYEEIATDPSYFNQILVMTTPMQGNYGASDSVWESARIHIQSMVCVEMQRSSAQEYRWKEKLLSYGIPILSGVDTRSVVLCLREKGTAWGAVVRSSRWQDAQKIASHLIVSAQKMESDWPFMVTTKSVQEIAGDSSKGPRIAVIDFGCKQNIIRNLKKRCSHICLFPSRTTEQEILKWKPSGLLLSNGPGNPADVQKSVETVKNLLGKMFVFGICMGHQILALALGGKTYKLKFGHRGSNHPVKDDLMKKIYITSQNHGYAVVNNSLPSHVQTTHVNLNDGTMEGFFSKQDQCMGIQFHPESCPGPHDAEMLFDLFIKQLVSSKTVKATRPRIRRKKKTETRKSAK